MGRKKAISLTERDQIIIGLNFFIVFAEILGLYLRLYILGSPGVEYYTVVSNFLALIASGWVLYDMFCTGKISHLASILRLTATVMLTVTFAVVLFILPWNMQTELWKLLLPGQMFFLHLSCPLLAIITFLFAERHRIFYKDANYICIPTVIYGVVVIIANLLGILKGPYPFITQLLSKPGPLLVACLAMIFVPICLAKVYIWYQKIKMQKIYDQRAEKKELKRGHKA